MMKKAVFTSLLLVASATANADNPVDPNAQNDISNLSQYVRVLGEYLGYDLTNYCPQTGGPCSSQPGSGQNFTNLLLNAAGASGNEVNLMASVVGALLPSNPANFNSESGGTSYQVIPSTSANLAAYYNLFTKYGNQTFPQFSTQSASGVSVTNLVDQSPYQNDPVSQAILNILATPDASYCVNPGKGYFTPCYTGENNSNRNGGGPVLSQNQVIMNVVGNPVPATGMFPLPATNQQIVPQLSSDSLLGPMMFSTSGSNQSDTSAGVNSGQSGLGANNQVQQAANYIRYATGEVVPLTLPNRTDYDNLYATAINAAGNVSQDQQVQAQTMLSTYINNLRVYAAQMSVGVSNLYYILSKRMPQNAAAGNNEQTSQALSEFTMATWRLYSPTSGNSNQANQQWLAQINQASSATVQKETAILLAEINYQLYLSRQLQERILLTNTMMLIQNTRAAQPSASISSAANSSTSTSSNGTDGSDSE